MRSAILFVLLASLWPMQAAHAQSPADVVRNWGLLGAWRYKCDVAPSRSNVGQGFVVRNGQAALERDYGDTTDRNPITVARVRPDGALSITMYFPALSATRENVFMKEPDGRLRTLFSRDVNTDAYFIRDGLLVSSGEPFIFLTRCGPAS